jgi:hypothetical protein
MGHDGGEADYVHMNNIRTRLLAYNYTTVHQEYDGSVPGLTNTTCCTDIKPDQFRCKHYQLLQSWKCNRLECGQLQRISRKCSDQCKKTSLYLGCSLCKRTIYQLRRLFCRSMVKSYQPIRRTHRSFGCAHVNHQPALGASHGRTG